MGKRCALLPAAKASFFFSLFDFLGIALVRVRGLELLVCSRGTSERVRGTVVRTDSAAHADAHGDTTERIDSPDAVKLPVSLMVMAAIGPTPFLKQGLAPRGSGDEPDE